MAKTMISFALVVFAAFLSGTFTESASAKPVACNFFEYKNAEKLLGHKAAGVDSHESKDDGSQRWACTFSSSGSEGRIFFVLIKDASEEAAKAEFEKVRSSNKGSAEFENWPGVADEAVAQTDGKNFQFVMVRKGTRTIRIKIHSSASVSFDDVKAIAESLAAKLI